jgi:hypothetical protein
MLVTFVVFSARGSNRSSTLSVRPSLGHDCTMVGPMFAVSAGSRVDGAIVGPRAGVRAGSRGVCALAAMLRA